MEPTNHKQMCDLLASKDELKLTQAEIKQWLISVLQDDTIPCTLTIDRRAYQLSVFVGLDMLDLMNRGA